MNTPRKLLVLLCIGIAVALLYPGVTQPVLTLTGTIEKSDVARLGVDMLAGEGADSQTRQMLMAVTSFMGLDQVEGELVVYDNTRSIWGTANELARTGNLLVAMLIVLFSVVIPSFKLLLQAGSVAVPHAGLRHGLLWLNGALSKWSMADVFVMGVLVAYMAGSASEPMGDMLSMTAQLQPGFYYFLGYCLFSVAAGALLLREPAAAGLTAGPSSSRPN